MNVAKKFSQESVFDFDLLLIFKIDRQNFVVPGQRNQNLIFSRHDKFMNDGLFCINIDNLSVPINMIDVTKFCVLSLAQKNECVETGYFDLLNLLKGNWKLDYLTL